MREIESEAKQKLILLAGALVDQRKARVLVPALRAQDGFWFGAGSVVEDADGGFVLSGRYRNAGDSRTGLRGGERGAELAVFRSDDRGAAWRKVLSFSKADLGYGDREVLSIEGSCLHPVHGGMELYVSSEKSGIPYAAGFEEFQKPGTGVWSIDRLAARSMEELGRARPHPLLECREPSFLHVKDPAVFDLANGDTALLFCTHPFTWASSNSGVAVRRRGAADFGAPDYRFFPRGTSWDVAISRLTGRLPVPRMGVFRSRPPLTLYFYDGGEAMRCHEEHPQAVKRPRGCSCEELGGLAWAADDSFPRLERLSPHLPLFVSPYGTGCSRYVSTLSTREGIFAFWQQSQPDRSQPLVGNFLPAAELERILS